MNPLSAAPADQLAPGPAAPLQQLLESAAKDADFAAQVAVSDDGTSLAVTVFSSRTPWVTTPESASSWLTEAGIDATATFNDSFCIVVVLDTDAAVHRFIAAVLHPWIAVHSVAAELIDVLEARGVLIEAAIDTDRIRAELPDRSLGSSVRLAALLGATGISDGLALHEPDGMLRLAERIQWLITGVVGSTTRVTVEPGCAHEQEQLRLGLTLAQARLLTRRLARQQTEEAPTTRIGASQ
ncbi:MULTISPECIES: hypothetical protein [unclassified Streptomyces]|uniref:hypothetical protein n=1 Tax=unclassified Streptomyces TaxID=2593676 RepID=UPI003816637D